MTIPELHQAILVEATRILNASAEHTQTYGRDLMDLPTDELILDGVKLNYPDGALFIKTGKGKSTSSIELTKTTNAARPTFEWLAEITIKQPNEVEHYLLCPDQSIIETYGKNVFQVDVERARQLFERLQQI